MGVYTGGNTGSGDTHMASMISGGKNQPSRGIKKAAKAAPAKKVAKVAKKAVAAESPAVESAEVGTPRQKKATAASKKVPRKVAKAAAPTARVRRQATLMATKNNSNAIGGY